LKALFAIKEELKYKTKLLPQQLHIIMDKVNDYTGKEKTSYNEEMSYADFLYRLRLVHKNKGGTKKMRRTRVRGTNSPKTTKKMRRTRVRGANSSKTTKKMRRTRVRGTNSPKTTKKMRGTRVGGTNSPKNIENDVEKYFAEKIHTVQDAANHFVWNVIKEELKEKNIKDHKDENKLGDLHVYLDGTEMVFDLTNVDTET
jgi:hypothetical protein